MVKGGTIVARCAAERLDSVLFHAAAQYVWAFRVIRLKGAHARCPGGMRLDGVAKIPVVVSIERHRVHGTDGSHAMGEAECPKVLDGRLSSRDPERLLRGGVPLLIR